MHYTTDQIIEKLKQLKVVPVIALDNSKDILPLAKVLSDNGLPVVEITFRSETAEEAIELIKVNYPDMLVIAGSILTKEQVLTAKNAGVDCIVTPGFNSNVVQYCQKLGIPVIPGVNNPMAIEAALHLGINTVKFFPAEISGGISMIKALLGPYGNLQIMPTGGINQNNIKNYLAIPNIIACGGSWFVEKSLINGQKWDEIVRLVREVVELVK